MVDVDTYQVADSSSDGRKADHFDDGIVVKDAVSPVHSSRSIQLDEERSNKAPNSREE